MQSLETRLETPSLAFTNLRRKGTGEQIPSLKPKCCQKIMEYKVPTDKNILSFVNCFKKQLTLRIFQFFQSISSEKSS